MAELIKTTDSLNDGRKKLNDAITDSNAALSTANTAKQTANLAKAESESTQTQLDTIVIEGDSSVEAAQARVNNSGTAFPTLKQRLDAENQEVTAQLQQTMTQTEFDSWVSTILDGGPSIFMDSLSALQTAYPSGSAGVALVRETEPARLYAWSGSQWKDFGPYQGLEVNKKSVTLDKLHPEVMTEHVGNNLIDAKKINLGGYYHYETGVWTPQEEFGATELTPVSLGEALVKSLAGSVTYWKADGTFHIGANDVPVNFNVPSDSAIAYISLNVYGPPERDHRMPIGEWMLARGSSLPDYYEPHYKYAQLNNKIGLRIDHDIVELNETLRYVQSYDSVNMIDPSTLMTGGYYDYKTGAWTSSANFAVHAPVAVAPGEALTKTFRGSVTYRDASDRFLFGQNNVEINFTVPNDPRIRYIIVNQYTSDLSPEVTIDKWILRRGHHPVNTHAYIPYTGNKKVFPAKHYMFEGATAEVESLPYLAPEIKEYSKVTNPIITKEIVTDRNAIGVADPFIVKEKGVYHTFFEVLMDTSTENDEIGHAYSHNLKDWTYTQIVLSKAQTGHRSAYPNVFKYENEYYMIPDRTGNAVVYKATNFPLEWTLETTLLTGQYVDTNVFEVGDVWYLTTTRLGNGALSGHNMTLFVNTSGDWRNGLWTEHPSGDILQMDGTERGKRNAGKILHGGDHIIFPVQKTPVASGVYGEYTDWYKLSELSPTACTVTKLDRIMGPVKDGGWRDKSMHHIANVEHKNGFIFAVDGQKPDGEYAIGLYTDIKE